MKIEAALSWDEDSEGDDGNILDRFTEVVNNQQRIRLEESNTKQERSIRNGELINQANVLKEEMQAIKEKYRSLMHPFLQGKKKFRLDPEVRININKRVNISKEILNNIESEKLTIQNTDNIQEFENLIYGILKEEEIKILNNLHEEAKEFVLSILMWIISTGIEDNKAENIKYVIDEITSPNKDHTRLIREKMEKANHERIQFLHSNIKPTLDNFHSSHKIGRKQYSDIHKILSRIAHKFYSLQKTSD